MSGQALGHALILKPGQEFAQFAVAAHKAPVGDNTPNAIEVAQFARRFGRAQFAGDTAIAQQDSDRRAAQSFYLLLQVVALLGQAQRHNQLHLGPALGVNDGVAPVQIGSVAQIVDCIKNSPQQAR